MTPPVILLVEDNPYDIELTIDAFQNARISNELVVVRDGVEALDYLFATGAYAERDQHVLPQVVLLDLQLPRISGLEVLQRLREAEHTRNLPVVILTSSDQEHDMLRSYNLGANSFVTKPVGMPQFTEAVQQLGLYWLLLNKVPSEGT
jgi:two-component system response regulator